MRMTMVAAALAAGAAAAPASAAETLTLPRFEQIEVVGGGSVTVRHGARQKVTIVRGDNRTSRVEVTARSTGGRGRSSIGSNPRLVVEGCRSRCPRGYRLELVVETPDIRALAVKGGGAIRAENGFPRQDQLAISVHGGGQIDTRSVRADSVAASVNGGGLITLAADESLAASVNGGGAIRYWGDPQVATAIKGGGTVSRVR